MSQSQQDRAKRAEAFQLRALLHDFGDMLVQRDELYELHELRSWHAEVMRTLGRALTTMERRMEP